MEPPSEAEIEQLIATSSDMKDFAYCPYSKFRVGAALLGMDGHIYTGCNVENACINGGICAEGTAIVKAVSEGCLKFKAIAISSDKEDIIAPCGICRQQMVEFGADLQVIMSRKDGSFILKTIQEMLPHGFTRKDLTL